jgi:hypothetical protein
MVSKLEDQLKLLADPSFKKTLRHRSKNEETGKTDWTETEQKVRPWWKEQDGSVIFFIKSGFKPIEIARSPRE